MFYTLEEAAARLGKSEDAVREMAESGQIQEFRDRDKLMFKVDQIDLLAADDSHDPSDMSSMIPLADDLGSSRAIDLDDDDSSEESSAAASASGGGTSLSLSSSSSSEIAIDEPSLEGSGPGASGTRGGSGSGTGLGDSKGKSGISIFDADDLEEADPSAVTQVSDQGIGEISLENVGGSGSGLMDLTRESDDTSLGADAFLDDILATDAQSSAAGAPGPMPTSGDLFEGAETDTEMAAAAPAGYAGGGGVAVAMEPYDGSGSGLVGGLCFGAVVAL
ncbi:MAG: helix-turn-helix domain-containing protein, partial [Planctomycetota bacterium]|nr:helix-turn-helix domain-containing protein [Planctomycetota bacterium]